MRYEVDYLPADAELGGGFAARGVEIKGNFYGSF